MHSTLESVLIYVSNTYIHVHIYMIDKIIYMKIFRGVCWGIGITVYFLLAS